MHLVRLGLEPVEEPADAVPSAGLPQLLERLHVRRAVAAPLRPVAVVNPFAHVVVELFPRHARIDPAFAAAAHQVA